MESFLGNSFNKETENEVYFYTPTFYALDNFSAYSIEIWGKKFQTVEHAYQYKKFEKINPNIAEKIMNAINPHEVKKISELYKDSVPQEFHENKVSIMEEILRAKASQHEKVREILEMSGRKALVENSPVDNFWGIGAHGTGENILGKLWMKIREGL